MYLHSPVVISAFCANVIIFYCVCKDESVCECIRADVRIFVLQLLIFVIHLFSLPLSINLHTKSHSIHLCVRVRLSSSLSIYGAFLLHFHVIVCECVRQGAVVLLLR